MSDNADLGIRLSDLWSAERCAWHIDFDNGAGAAYPWTVELEWVQEHFNQHLADWVTFTWLFYGETVEEALKDAVAWCEGLVPFERCGECAGEDEYGLPTDRHRCDECDGSGLAHPEQSERGRG